MLDLGDGLRRRGHEVSMAVRPTVAELQRQFGDAGFECLPLNASVRTKADIWHLHLHNTLDSHAFPPIVARGAARRGAVILTEHLPRTFRTDPTLEVDPTYPPGRKKPGAAFAKRMMKRGEFRAARHVIAPSRSAADFLHRTYGLSTRRLSAVYNGLAPLDTVPPLPDDPQLHVVAVGALTWRKGFDVLLAARALAQEPWRLTIIGDGEDRGALEATAAALPPGAVTFAGWVDDVHPLLTSAHVLAMPSRVESFSYVTVEAMLRGRPVVASRIEGPDEIVRDGVDGYLVRSEDPQALADQLDVLARDRALVQRLGASAVERARDAFGLDAMVDATAEIYRRTAR
jgi:glycosyltransferase involved in cell wall biosynthesis